MNQSGQKNLKQAECDSMKRRTGAQAESNREFTVVRRGSEWEAHVRELLVGIGSLESQQKGFVSFLSIIHISL